MIIIRLIGGLGNQMFQYAAGRKLALEKNTELVLDISAFENYTLRKYSLSAFCLHSRTATPQEISHLKETVLKKIKNRLGFKKHQAIFSKKFSTFGEYHTIIERDGYGYWNNKKTVEGIKDILRKDFTLKDAQGEKFDEMTRKITGANSVSLHVRRGDYLAKKHINIYAECKPEYYQNAITHIKKYVDDIHVFVFSDDVAWVKENLKIDVPFTIVSDECFADYQELMLMSFCKHNITANSTFSWWGAWLNKNPEKIIITPKNWFVDPNLINLDIIPKTWTSI